MRCPAGWLHTPSSRQEREAERMTPIHRGVAVSPPPNSQKATSGSPCKRNSDNSGSVISSVPRRKIPETRECQTYFSGIFSAANWHHMSENLTLEIQWN
jgi:hypothetical protein